ncbi:MAG: hypothetical protein NT001_04440 [Candidatus Woesearchaeota archaeon]|nr:hypothetical protein [Candidatus Woesearchaeota archaeon]
MALDGKISTILEGIEIEEREDGRLVLHSQSLEEVQKLYQSNIPVLGKIIDYIARINKPKKEELLQHLIAKNLGNYLRQKISETDSDKKKEQSERLLTAFNHYHNIRINHLSINHNDINRPNFFVRNLGYFVGVGLIAAQYVIPDLEDIPNYMIYSAIIGANIGAGIHIMKKIKNQKVDFPVPSIDEIKDDIAKLSEKYMAAEEKHPEEMDSYEITASQLEKLIPKLTAEAADQIRRLIDSMSEGTTATLSMTKTGQYDAAKVPEMKKAVDRYVQQYCPTLDLENVKVEVSKLRLGCGGISPFRKNVVKISRSYLDSNMNGFYRIYAHELAHIDGVYSEGMADYQAMQVISDMQSEFPDQRHGFEFYDTLLTAAVHTYVIERKKSIRNGKTKLSHLCDIIGYNAKKVLNGVLRRGRN